MNLDTEIFDTAERTSKVIGTIYSSKTSKDGWIKKPIAQISYVGGDNIYCITPIDNTGKLCRESVYFDGTPYDPEHWRVVLKGKAESAFNFWQNFNHFLIRHKGYHDVRELSQIIHNRKSLTGYSSCQR